MNINLKIKSKEILISFIFTISIFFWSSSIFNFDLRFLIIFLIFTNSLILKNNFNWFSIFIIIHSILLSIFFDLKINNELLITYTFLYLISSITFFYIDVIKKNILTMIYFFVIILLFLLAIQVIFFDNKDSIIVNCYLGCFSFKKFIYQENSHFGVTIAPVIIFLAINILEKFNLKKFFSLLFLMTIAFYNYSNSLLIIIILSTAGMMIFDYKYFTSKKMISIFFLLLYSLALYLSNNHNFKQRFVLEKFDFPKSLEIDKNINLSSKEKKNLQIINEYSSLNLSTEVLIKSFKISMISFKENIFGVGINNFEHSHDKYINKVNLVHQESARLNKKDGANNFNKILTEFGIFGLIYIFSLIYFFFFSKQKLDYKYFIISLICSQTFIRGYGYFNGGFLIILSLLIYDVYYKNQILNKRQEK